MDAYAPSRAVKRHLPGILDVKTSIRRRAVALVSSLHCKPMTLVFYSFQEWGISVGKIPERYEAPSRIRVLKGQSHRVTSLRGTIIMQRQCRPKPLVNFDQIACGSAPQVNLIAVCKSRVVSSLICQHWMRGSLGGPRGPCVRVFDSIDGANCHIRTGFGAEC